MKSVDSQGATIRDLEAFRLTAAPPQLQRLSRGVPQRTRTRRPGLFVKGPIDWQWLAAAGQLPGKALHVALTLRLLEGMETTRTVALSSARLEEVGVSRHAAYRALHALEDAGLVKVVRHRGRQPRVTVLEA